MYWQLPGAQVHLKKTCYIGILNITPDSFSDGGMFADANRAISHGLKLISRGAQIIDIGAESTRPGSQPVSPDEEWKRLAPVISGLRNELPKCTLSIDTHHPDVARKALESGIDIINDVTGFQNPEMLDLIANSNCGIIAMRIRMVDGQICMPDYFDHSKKEASMSIRELGIVKERLLSSGIAPERILLDPGFGFGTTFSEDRAIWETLPDIPALLDWPVERFCIGISRKRFVARTFDVGENDLLDLKTAEMHEKATDFGYKVFRTHAIRRNMNGT